MNDSPYMTLENTIGNTPLVKLQRIVPDSSNTVLAKLEGNNPAGSVKDRPALWMIERAEKEGKLTPTQRFRRKWTLQVIRSRHLTRGHLV